MKIEDSGMPEERYWKSLFDIDGIVAWLGLPASDATVVEIGCGYGTFTVPVAQRCAGRVLAFDIEPEMIATARRAVREAGLANVDFALRDVLEAGTGLEAGVADLVLLFNLLHFSERDVLLREAARVLCPGGVVAIIHWRKDIPTPRGPALALRPDPDQILAAAAGLDLRFEGASTILEPYHWGMKLIKGAVGAHRALGPGSPPGGILGDER